MIVKPARSTRLAYLAAGLVSVVSGAAILVAMAPHPYGLVVGPLFVVSGLVVLIRVRRLGLYITGDQASLVSVMWTWKFSRSEIVGIAEYPAAVETRIKGRVGVLNLSIFYTSGPPNQKGSTYKAQEKALEALSEWTGVPIIRMR